MRFFNISLTTLLICAALAKAETVSFATGNGPLPVFTAPSNAFTITAEAYESTAFTPSFPLIASLPLKQTNNGLGIKGHGFGQSDSQIDGVGFNEFLRLTFSRTVALSAFTVTNVDTGWLTGGTDGVRLWEENNIHHDTFPLTTNPQTITFATPLIGQAFTFTVAGMADLAAFSDFTLFSIDAMTVPFPSAAYAGMLLLAVIGIIRFRRLRS